MINELITLLLFLLTLQNGVNSFTIYDTRLGSGSAAYQGRVEVLTYRGWQPVCAWSWYSQESRVLCRQLGYGYSTYRRSSSSVNSLQYTFYCSGAEPSISQCRYTFFYEQQTSCSDITTVFCVPCSNGNVQLRGGVVPEAGTVEYCTSGTWKAVCDNSWDNKDAFITCRQLGFPATDAIQYVNSYFGTHPFPSGVYFNCFGNETSLSNCQSSTSSSCGSDDAAGVYCKGDIITDQCINGHIRLAGGMDANEGRVEICSNGVWGTVYGSGWDSRDAIVACRQLGQYQAHSRVEVFPNGYFGTGSGPILFAYLSCDGTESRLSDCSTYRSFPFGASHSSDAGVRCERTTLTVRSNCINGNVRLVNGSSPYEGRVEICYSGIWGSVCDNSWSYWDAAIVCRQLGFQGTNATALGGPYFGDGEGPYHLSGINCNGHEQTLLQCSYRQSSNVRYHNCAPGQDAGVRCDASTCSHGEVRLFGGYTESDGVAEVCLNGFWADICDDVSDKIDIARTFCRQFIGTEPSFAYSSCCTRQRNSGSITLYDVTCSAQSRTLIQDCQFSRVSGYSTSSCNLQEELIVGCYKRSSCTSGDLRLVNGSSKLEGRVEVCSQGIWGTIAADNEWYYRHPFYWDSRDWDSLTAMVVCRQLGYQWEWALLVQSNLFGKTNTRHVAFGFRCTGNEEQLVNCSHTTVSGRGYEIYSSDGVICQGNTSAPTECKHGDIRLVNGVRETEGRIEICAYGYWAMVCDGHYGQYWFSYTLWDNTATQLVCKQLGLPTEAYEYLSGSPFGSNYQLPLVGLSCGSGARNVSECQVYNQTNNCNHRRTIGVFCKDREEYYQIAIHVFPAQGNHDIGSRVTLSCTVTPSPQKYKNFTFQGSLTYRWYSADRGSFSSSRTVTITIASYKQNFGDYYCLIYRRDFLLGIGKIALNLNGVLRPSMNMSSPVKIQALQKQRAIVLEVNTSNHNVVDLLLGLTWYHNGSVIVPGDDSRLTLSNSNKTLTISNFSSSYAGIYKAQFNQLFVHPFDENCKEEVLPLMRNYPVLKPAVFCVNMDSDCSDATIESQEWKISIRSVDYALQGTFNNVTLEADATVLSIIELEHSTIYWYRNGIRITSSLYLSMLRRNYNKLSLNQRFQQFNTTYEHSGRYEVHLKINMNTYLQAGSTCRPYYDRFVSSYLRSAVTLAKGYIDIGYHKDLTFILDADKIATIRNAGATLICRASIQFPPFSMLSLIKNGQTVSSSINGSLQINTKTVDANPFGLYTCQLNASGEMFQKIYFLKEQANLRMILDITSSNICSNSGIAIKYIEKALILKIKHECRCNFNPEGFQNSSINCGSSNELVYTTNIEYSSEDGSETASIIVNRLVGQIPFSMAVGGSQLIVTSACTDCEIPTAGASLSPAAGGGLFIGGFIAAILITIILVIIAILVRKRFARSKGRGRITTEIKSDPLRYASGTGAAHVSFKGAEHATSYHPEKPRDYEPMGTLDQQSQYDTVPEPVDQPIYEETF